MVKIIQLTNPEPRETLTHYKICAWKFEVPRADLQKEGSIKVWIARCYKNGGEIYQESEGPGMEIDIVGEEFTEFTTLPTSLQGLMADSLQILGQFIIDKGYIDGTLVEE